MCKRLHAVLQMPSRAWHTIDTHGLCTLPLEEAPLQPLTVHVGRAKPYGVLLVKGVWTRCHTHMVPSSVQQTLPHTGHHAAIMSAPTDSPRSLRVRQAGMLQWLHRVGGGAEHLKAAFSPCGHLSTGA